MKVINVGLSILISMGLAISPIQANEIDVADETNEEGVLSTDENETEVVAETDSNSLKLTNVVVTTQDNVLDYVLDENETKTIQLKVIKEYDDGTQEETTDYSYMVHNTDYVSLTNKDGLVNLGEMQPGTNNEISVTKTSRGYGRITLNVYVDGNMYLQTFIFSGSKLVNITMDVGEGSFEDGSTTYTYKAGPGYPLEYPGVSSPEGCGLVGWYNKDGVDYYNYDFSKDDTFYARYGKLINVTYDAGEGHFDNGKSVETRQIAVNNNPICSKQQSYIWIYTLCTRG